MRRAKTVISTKKYYVYTLSYPDGTVFYVGKGSGSRIKNHVHQAIQSRKLSPEDMRWRGYNARRCKVILEILDRGEQVKEDVVFETDSEQEALIYEWGLTYAYDRDHFLTNGERHNPGPYTYKYLPQRQGIYRVYPKNKHGVYIRVDVTPV